MELQSLLSEIPIFPSMVQVVIREFEVPAGIVKGAIVGKWLQATKKWVDERPLSLYTVWTYAVVPAATISIHWPVVPSASVKSPVQSLVA
jgi:hypothetical protein